MRVVSGLFKREKWGYSLSKQSDKVYERHLKALGDNMEAKWRKANERFLFVTGGEKEGAVGGEKSKARQ